MNGLVDVLFNRRTVASLNPKFDALLHHGNHVRKFQEDRVPIVAHTGRFHVDWIVAFFDPDFLIKNSCGPYFSVH